MKKKIKEKSLRHVHSEKIKILRHVRSSIFFLKKVGQLPRHVHLSIQGKVVLWPRSVYLSIQEKIVL